MLIRNTWGFAPTRRASIHTQKQEHRLKSKTYVCLISYAIQSWFIEEGCENSCSLIKIK